MATVIKDRRLRKALNAEGMEDLYLVKGKGYFYITSNTKCFFEDSIYICNFADQDIKAWVEDIKKLNDPENFTFFKSKK